MRTNVRAALPVIGGVALAAVIGAAGPAGAQADPPGNNGTVKIDGVEFDDHPDNEPHVGCEFQVDFYGFDEGDLYADVTFGPSRRRARSSRFSPTRCSSARTTTRAAAARPASTPPRPTT